MKGKINEIFYSMQGEGLYLGQRQLFVRFFGCNLRCGFCDTKLNSFREYEPGELFKEIKLFKKTFRSISFTGGEPLLQKDFLKEISKRTARQDYRNYLETNATLPAELEEVIKYIDVVAMDIKLPSSTGRRGFWRRHSEFLRIASKKEVFLKAIICRSTTESDLRKMIELINKSGSCPILILQPDSRQDPAALEEKLQKYKDICRRERITACVIAQVHKKIGIK